MGKAIAIDASVVRLAPLVPSEVIRSKHGHEKMSVSQATLRCQLADGFEIRSVLLIAWPLLPKAGDPEQIGLAPNTSLGAGHTGWCRMCGRCICHFCEKGKWPSAKDSY